MRTDKDQAIAMRKAGKSYRQIQAELGIARSTLTSWFSGQIWNNEIAAGNASRKVVVSRETAQRLALQRRLAIQYQHALTVKQAVALFAQHEHDPLFWAGLMLYGCNGDTSSKYTICFSSADPSKHRIFLAFMEKYFSFLPDHFAFHLTVYANTVPSEAVSYWQKHCAIPASRYNKIMTLSRATAKGGLQNGIGASIMTSAITKDTLMQWLALTTKAVMV